MKDGKRVIAVVMNAVDEKGTGSYKARFDATRALFDYGFTQFSEVEFVPAGYKFENQKSLNVTKGKEDTVEIAVKEPVKMMVKTRDKDLYKPELVLDESMLTDGELVAPVKKDAVVGHVKLVHTEGKDLGYIDTDHSTVEVVTTESVEKAGWFSLSMRAIGDFFVSVWGSAIGFVKGLFS